jgi:hypothetical protein
MIIWLASYPRSGNSFFRMVLAKAFGVKSGSVYVEAPDGEVTIAPEAKGAEPFASSPDPIFVKTHKLQEEVQGPAIYIVRDGRDAIVSFARYGGKHFPRFEGMDFEQIVVELMERPKGFGTWSNHVRAWTERTEPPVIVHFEELVRDPVRVVGEAISAVEVDVPLTPQGRAPSFAELQERAPQLFRRGEVGGWRGELSAPLEKKFWRQNAAVMKRMGYVRDPSRRRRFDLRQYLSRRAR